MRHTIVARCMAAVLSAALLTGCKGTEKQNGGEVFIDHSTEAPREEKILRFFAPVDSKSTGAIAYRKLIDQYNASQSEVHVVFEGVATADGFNRYLEERLDAGAGDDVFIINEDSVKPLHAKGYLYDLSALPTYQKLNRAAKEEAVIGDIAYCIPVNMTAYALYVNLEVLEQYQLQPPENLQEFMMSCETIKEAGGTPISISRWHAIAVPTIANGLWQVYGSRQRQEILQGLNTGELQIGDYMLDGFRLFWQFVEDGWYGDGLDGAAVDLLRAGQQDIPDFAADKTAFYFGPLEYMSWVEEVNPDLDYLVQGIPVQDGTVVLASVVSRLCVNADSRYLEEAQDFVAFMTEHIYQESVQNGEVLLPVYEGMDFSLGNEHMRLAYEAFLADRQFPAEDMRLSFTYWDTVRELCISMFDGMSPEEAAEEYNRIQKEQTAKYGIRGSKG